MMTDIIQYGYTSAPGDVGSDGTVARVTAVHKERYELACEKGMIHARLKSSVYFSGKEPAVFPTTGDFVRIQYNAEGDSLITETLERRSYFSRRDPTPGRGEQAVAANFDYVFILTSLNHEFNLRRLERYLTLAWHSGGLPVVVLTKADIAGDDCAETVRSAEAAAAGVCVYAVSAKTGQGLADLAEYLKPGKTIVFLGSSGVGKSSLVNALAGEEIMKVNEIREDDAHGRHTTTHRQLIALKSGVMIIDTPGMRELGMWDVSHGIGEAFADVYEFVGKCKFKDCKHGSEPGCALRKAVENGELSSERWESYKRLKHEAKYSDDKEAYMREKRAWSKTNAKFNRQFKKL